MLSVLNSAPANGNEAVKNEPTLRISGPNAYWQDGELATAATGTVELQVDENARYQEWHGFGGSFNEAGWDALGTLDEPERARAIALLFDPGQGAGFVHGRIPIGASDFALDRYSLNDEMEDYAMGSFSIERDRRLLIPYVKAALAINGGLQLSATPWSPPSWMKQNSAADGGAIRDEPRVLEAYALYLARMVEDYAAEGIKIGAIHPQNEPGYERAYPSCSWSPELLRDFIRDYLGPTFAARGSSAEIWLGTMSAPQDVQHVSVAMADARASQYVKGIGLQWNMLRFAPEFAADYSLPIMQTEHKCGNYPWRPEAFCATSAPNDHAYAEHSWRCLTVWITAGVSSYLAWNMILDTVGMNLDLTRPWPQNALLTVDRSARKLTVTPAYYVFRHVSQYVRRGARRLGTIGYPDALAFENPDGSIVTIVHNPESADRKMTLGVGTCALRLRIPAHGWATVHQPATLV